MNRAWTDYKAKNGKKQRSMITVIDSHYEFRFTYKTINKSQKTARQHTVNDNDIKNVILEK